MFYCYSISYMYTEKTEVFLELFGNSEIRHHTEETLKHVAAQLYLAVTDTLSSDTHTHPCMDISLLKVSVNVMNVKFLYIMCKDTAQLLLMGLFVSVQY